MSTFIPITADRVCLAFTEHTTVHASACSPVELLAADPLRREHRTVCGSDSFLLAHAVVGRCDDRLLATWPPPIELRCPDCARLTGVGGRQRAGSAHWRELRPTEALV